jgi:hypothetical protein
MNGKRRRKLATVVGVTVLMAALAVPTSLPASAADAPDQVLAWNQHAYDELILGAPASWKSPVVSALHLAMVHGAIYDAVNAIAGGYEPYLVAPATADSTDSEDAAAAAAGYQVLLDILKPPLILEADVPTVAARLLGYYNDSLTAISNAGVPQSSIDGGVAVGNAAAQAMIAERTGDGRYGDPSFDVGFDVGEWRPLAEGLAGNNFYWVGQVVPFLVPDAAMFGTRGPNAVTSAKYTREFNRVKSLGAIDSTTRRADQTAMANFWADHAIGMWTRIFRQLSVANQLSTAENARYFGMLYLTVGDAVIACNLDKAKWGFWRPTTAIREAATDGNPLTEADATWESLNPVPPYPEHPSGHNCGSWSIVETLKDFYGTNRMTFNATRTFPQPGPAPITRTFTRFSQAGREILRARVFGGLHFWTAEAQGARLGRRVANWRQEHYFQPVA